MTLPPLPEPLETDEARSTIARAICEAAQGICVCKDQTPVQVCGTRVCNADHVLDVLRRLISEA